jgi:hypothetical protein
MAGEVEVTAGRRLDHIVVDEAASLDAAQALVDLKYGIVLILYYLIVRLTRICRSSIGPNRTASRGVNTTAISFATHGAPLVNNLYSIPAFRELNTFSNMCRTGSSSSYSQYQYGRIC